MLHFIIIYRIEISLIEFVGNAIKCIRININFLCDFFIKKVITSYK